ncbi:MAG: hypothetical protein PHH84_09020 [Oscillospiraceae bacterium]|nr:hypothetical protein [Oscillospiraceae bacterium]MDD4414215.1 hypothetical protein [Oscillospiraceae bacterium]
MVINMVKWLIICGINLILGTVDGMLTYLNTSDLSMESNPLISCLGMGWKALFISNFIVLGLCILTGYYSFVKYRTAVLNAKNLRQYISLILYNRPDKFVWFLYRMPKNPKPFFAILGYVLGYTLILGRAVVIFEWTLVSLKADLTGYYRLVGLFPLGRIDLVLVFAASLYLIMAWFINEYKKSKRYYEHFIAKGL